MPRCSGPGRRPADLWAAPGPSSCFRVRTERPCRRRSGSGQLKTGVASGLSSRPRAENCLQATTSDRRFLTNQSTDAGFEKVNRGLPPPHRPVNQHPGDSNGLLAPAPTNAAGPAGRSDNMGAAWQVRDEMLQAGFHLRTLVQSAGALKSGPNSVTAEDMTGQKQDNIHAG